MTAPSSKTSIKVPHLNLNQVQLKKDEESPKAKSAGNSATKAITESSVSAGYDPTKTLSEKNVSVKPPSPRDEKASDAMTKEPAKDEGKKEEASSLKVAQYAKAAFEAHRKGALCEIH